MNDAASPDAATDATAYERLAGRWSRLVADEFLRWIRGGVPQAGAWLDVGCGTGALSAGILARTAPVRVTGVDPSEERVAYARAHVVDPRADFRVGEARSLPVESGAFDAVVSGLVLNFIADPAEALDEMRRVMQPGGRIAAYVWDYAGEMQMLRHFWDAATALDPAARALDEGARSPLCQPDALHALFKTAGLTGVDTRAIDVPTVFQSFDDYWSPFLSGNGAAPTYCASLTVGAQSALRERIRASLVADSDGKIRLIARAWAAKGRT